MPFVGLGLHIFVALFFAIHALRSGQNMYWLIILFSFPLLGSIAYFIVIFLPSSRIERGAKSVVRAAVKALDPTRELREARDAFEYTPTAQNQMRLSAALLEAGLVEEAAANYESCLKGPFAADLEIRFGAARASMECQRYAQAIAHLQSISASTPSFRPEQVALLLARALGSAGRTDEAKAEFESAVERFGSFEARAEYAIWAAASNDRDTVTRLKAEIEQATKRWSRHTRELNAPLLRRLSAAMDAVGKRTA
ncbi:MAG: tetratricopeptide repeat protein [Burkholderiaceae bacterium]